MNNMQEIRKMKIYINIWYIFHAAAIFNLKKSQNYESEERNISMRNQLRNEILSVLCSGGDALRFVRGIFG